MSSAYLYLKEFLGTSFLIKLFKSEAPYVWICPSILFFFFFFHTFISKPTSSCSGLGCGPSQLLSLYRSPVHHRAGLRWNKQGLFRISNKCNLHVCGLWKEAKVPSETAHKQLGECSNFTQKDFREIQMIKYIVMWGKKKFFLQDFYKN